MDILETFPFKIVDDRFPDMVVQSFHFDNNYDILKGSLSKGPYEIFVVLVIEGTQESIKKIMEDRIDCEWMGTACKAYPQYAAMAGNTNITTKIPFWVITCELKIGKDNEYVQ